MSSGGFSSSLSWSAVVVLRVFVIVPSVSSVRVLRFLGLSPLNVKGLTMVCVVVVVLGLVDGVEVRKLSCGLIVIGSGSEVYGQLRFLSHASKIPTYTRIHFKYYYLQQQTEQIEGAVRLSGV